MINKLVRAVFLALLTSGSFAGINHYMIYTDPLPNSEMINKETGIIIKPGNEIDIGSLRVRGAVVIKGSVSGVKTYSFANTKDKTLLVLKPSSPFAAGETVTVKYTKLIKTSEGKKISPFEYSFRIKNAEPGSDKLPGLMFELGEENLNRLLNRPRRQNVQGGPPEIVITNDNNPSNGDLFLSNIVFNLQIPNQPYLIIYENRGTAFFERQLSGEAWNFDKQPSGLLTYYDQNDYRYYGMNSSYNITDTFSTGNGYHTDLHELRVLADGSAYLLSYDQETVDMSQYIQGGDPNATVVGLIIQQIDMYKNVIFQWRSWDHFSILDATHENFLASIIDYVHGNALEVENDGNIILSSRHMDEITKINRSNGDIIWRLGGKNNQFTFINDTAKFSHQHAIRRISPTNLTLFDNGNYHTPQYSRACEYNVNETGKTATLVWQFRNTPDYYGSAMGYVQRLPDGNTLISWGATNPTVTEVTPGGVKVFEMSLDTNVFTYRAFRYPWGDTLTGIASNSGAPKSFSLKQNYPNPFNPVTKIKFDVPDAGNSSGRSVLLVIYDELGREVATLVNQQLRPGTYEAEWDGTNSPSGVYFYKLEAGEFSQSKIMVLIK